jgi:hypothetical protein
MVLQQRPDALRPSYSTSITTATNTNNTLYNRQLDFTPSLLSQPPAQYVLDATFWKIEVRDAARRTCAALEKENTTGGSKPPPVLPVAPDHRNQQLNRIGEKGHKGGGGSQIISRVPHQPKTEQKRPRLPKLATTEAKSCITVKVTSEKTSRSGRNQSREPPTHPAEVFPASYGGLTSSDGSMLLDGVEAVDGPRMVDPEVYESEKWGGGRLIPSGLKVARPNDRGGGLNTLTLSSDRVSDKPPVLIVDVLENTVSMETHKLASPCTGIPAATLPLPQKECINVPSAAVMSPAEFGAPRRGPLPGTRGQWKGYVLAEDCHPTSKGKLLLLDAPPALLPQRSTRSGRVFKPEGDADQATEDDDSEGETRVKRRCRLRRAARKRVLLSEHSDE